MENSAECTNANNRFVSLSRPSFPNCLSAISVKFTGGVITGIIFP